MAREERLTVEMYDFIHSEMERNDELTSPGELWYKQLLQCFTLRNIQMHSYSQISDLSSLILKCFGTNVSETTVKRACKKLGWKKSAVKYCQIAWEKNRIEQLHFAWKALAEKAPFEKCQTLIP